MKSRFSELKRKVSGIFFRKKRTPLSKILYISRPGKLERFRKLPMIRLFRNMYYAIHKKIARLSSPRIIYTSASIGLLVFVIGMLFFSNFFIVSNVVVLRNSPFIPTDTIEKSLESSIGKNIFFVSTSGLENELKKSFPFIKTVTVSKMYPRVLQVTADSYQILATISEIDGNESFLLAENGSIIKGGETTSASISTGSLLKMSVPSYKYEESKSQVLDPKVKLISGKQFIPKDHMDDLHKILKLFDKNFPFQIVSLMYLPLEEEIHITTDKGFVILIWLQEPVETQLYKLKWKAGEPTMSIINGNIAYVDLRIKDRIDICEKGEECANYTKSILQTKK